MNRRHFLMSTAVMAGNAAVRGMQSPNETVRVGVVGCGGRGGSHVNAWSGMKNVEVVALCDIDESHIGNKMKALESKGAEKAHRLHRLPPAAREQGHRRRLDRHAEPLARAADHLGLPGGQGRLRREAVLAQRLRVAADRRGRPQVQPHRPAGQPEPLVTGAARRRSSGCGRASSARSTWRAACATSGATPSARRRGTGSAGRRLRPLAGSGAEAAVHQEPVPLQLALVLGYRQRRPRQPGHPRDRHGPLGPGRHPPDEGQRHRRQVHVRRRSGNAEHDQRRLRVRRRRQEEDDDLRGPALDLAARSGHPGREARQHDRQPVLRLEGLPRHRQLQQVLLVPRQGAAAGTDGDRSATSTGRTSSTPSAAASART